MNSNLNTNFSDFSRLRMQETNEWSHNSNSQYGQEHNHDSPGNNVGYEHGQVLGEVETESGYVNRYPAGGYTPWSQGNREPRH
ncbi:hypothetical protein K3495_g4917 [Podosphaera aphanis]|nr:hypothetical protein K3495_g4917 [Podosphaera aphanis]